jgi:hypothetical protein
VIVPEPETLVGPPLDQATGVGPLTLGGLLNGLSERFPDNEALEIVTLALRPLLLPTT